MSRGIRKAGTIFRRFRFLVGPDVLRLNAFAVLLGICHFVAEAAFPFLLQTFFARTGLVVSSQGPELFGLRLTLAAAVAGLIIFAIMRLFISSARSAVGGLAILRFVRRLRERLAAHTVRWAHREASHELSGMFSDRGNIASSVVQSLPIVVVNVVSGTFFFLFCLYLAPLELAVSLVLLALVFIPLKFMSREITVAGVESLSAWSALNEAFHVSLRNQVLLRIYSMEGRRDSTVGGALRTYERVMRRYYVFSSIKANIPIFAGLFVVLVVSLMSYRIGDTSGPALIAFLYVFMRFAQGCSEVVTATNDLRVNGPTLNYVYRFLLRIERFHRRFERRAGDRALVQRPVRDLVLEDVGFRWSEGSPWLFDGLSMTLRPGDCLVIKGPSGSGKSSLLGLLLGLESPTRGRILWNGDDSVARALADAVGYVGPEPFILSGTLTENLAFGHSQVPDRARVLDLLRGLKLNELASALENERDPQLNENFQLSTGQRQRVALARAFLRSPDVLVLDEATANLDEETEREVIALLRPRLQGLITVIVTHKDSFDRIATREIKLGAPASGV